jgi:hypothetical protein
MEVSERRSAGHAACTIAARRRESVRVRRIGLPRVSFWPSRAAGHLVQDQQPLAGLFIASSDVVEENALRDGATGFIPQIPIDRVLARALGFGHQSPNQPTRNVHHGDLHVRSTQARGNRVEDRCRALICRIRVGPCRKLGRRTRRLSGWQGRSFTLARVVAWKWRDDQRSGLEQIIPISLIVVRCQFDWKRLAGGPALEAQG